MCVRGRQPKSSALKAVSLDVLSLPWRGPPIRRLNISLDIYVPVGRSVERGFLLKIIQALGELAAWPTINIPVCPSAICMFFFFLS